MNDPLTQQLDTLRQLLHEYSDLAITCLNKNNLSEHAHHIHELRAKLDYLKYLSQEKQNNDDANQKNFLAHHALAIQHALNHHFFMESQLAAVELADALYEAQCKELQEIHRELQRLYELLRTQQEMKEHLPHPIPSLGGTHRDNND